MRKFVFLALFLVTVTTLAYSLGSAVDRSLIPQNVAPCDWDEIDRGELPAQCWDAKRSVIIMDGGRYEWDTRTAVLTDFGK